MRSPDGEEARGEAVFSETLRARLLSLGYSLQESDLPALTLARGQAEEILRARTNRTDLPEGLFFLLMGMTAGFFLKDKKAAGALDGSLDFSAAIPAKSISEGDVSVTFAVSDAASPADVFDQMLDRMTTPPDDLIAAYRRLIW